ncbi:MAG TPA: hypothetical protein VKY41_03100 [Xanthomarina sp.]|nr:hypothetical protein [Xanthomarina sp.]
MKTLKLATFLFLAFLTFNCSSDDDSPAPTPEPTTQELLMSGKWFIKSINGEAPENDCIKQTNWHFINEDTLITINYSINVDDECESESTNFNYILSNDGKKLVAYLEGESPEIVSIDSVSMSELIVSNPGIEIIFEK